MTMNELPHAPTLEVEIGRPELMRHNRWNAGYFEERFRQNEKKLKKLRSVPFGEFIPEELSDELQVDYLRTSRRSKTQPARFRALPASHQHPGHRH